jgi:acetyltransferase
MKTQEPQVRDQRKSVSGKTGLSAAFAPDSIAVVGASEKPGSVGRMLMENLATFGGRIYPVNPKRASVLGIATFPAVAAIEAEVDLAIVATPARAVPDVVNECAQAGVKNAVIISAGFKECGPEGAALETEIADRRGDMRIIGPNCLGIMVPHRGLNASFAGPTAKQGTVAFLSQSGALGASILDWSLLEEVGFSAFVSVGSMLDVGWGDLLYHFGDDLHTRSILLYMESVGDARSFLSAAREVALTKPIIVLKVGRTAGGARAVVSHTGSLTGNDEVLDAAFRRAGVLRVDSIEDLFGLAEVLAKQPRPRGPRMAIVTNGGGPGSLAVDALVPAGGELASLSESNLAELNSFLPPFWSKANPIDVLGDADADRFAKTIQIVKQDPGNDGILVILTPQAMTDPVATARHLQEFAKLDGKPILACWMGGRRVEEGAKILRESGIPTFRYPDQAAGAFCALWRNHRDLESLYETPTLRVESVQAGSVEQAESIIRKASEASRLILTEVESKELLETYGIRTVTTRVAVNENEAIELANSFGWPVVLKVHSQTITHKSDVDGVKLNLQTVEAVRQAYREIEQSVHEQCGGGAFQGVAVEPMIASEGYEIILGSATDPQLGPVILFGAGGQFVEIMKDRAIGLPPLNATLAQRIIEQCRIYRALQGTRGRPAIDLTELKRVLIRFSRLVAEQRRIKEIDINPLIVSASQIVAVDARVVLHDPLLPDEKLPKLAIRPYPAEYVFLRKLTDGSFVTLRPIMPEDEPLMAEFHKTLSETTIHYRYMASLKLQHRITHSRLSRICFNDYDREIALVIERSTKEREIIGVGRLIKTLHRNSAEFAIVLSDFYQGKGLGTEVLRQLLEVGRQEHIERIVGYILPDNLGMRRVCAKLGFQIGYDPDTEVFKAVISLKG